MDQLEYSRQPEYAFLALAPQQEKIKCVSFSGKYLQSACSISTFCISTKSLGPVALFSLQVSFNITTLVNIV